MTKRCASRAPLPVETSQHCYRQYEWANAAGALRQRTGYQQRGRHDGKGREEMQLSQPGHVETERVSVLDLHQGVFVALQGALLRGAGQLIKRAKLHVV